MALTSAQIAHPQEVLAEARVRVLARVDMVPIAGCWIWNRAIGTHGYGVITFCKKVCTAHRLAYEAFSGPISDGLLVLHRCDVQACCNPAHLFLGTHMDNIQDCKRKGRTARGTMIPHAKLSDEAVAEIRDSHLSHYALARRFGVSRTSISNVLNGKQWVRPKGGAAP